MTLETRWAITAAIFVVGLLLGRLLNRCIMRIPETVGLFKEFRQIVSRTPLQGQYPRGRWYHLLPVIGTLFLIGRSPFSGRRITLREPFVELLNGFLLASLFWLEIPASLDVKASSLAWPLGPEVVGGAWNSEWLFLICRYLYHVVLVEALVVGTFIDFDHYLLPDMTTLPALVVGVVGGTLAGGFWMAPLWFQDNRALDLLSLLLPFESVEWLKGPIYPPWFSSSPHLHAFLNSLAGLIVGSGMIWTIRWIGFVTLKREAMGFGDVILMAMVGTFVGWQNCVIIFFLAPVFAICVVIVSMAFFRRAIPYGPYLSLATLTVLYGWPQIWPSLYRFFSHGPLIPALLAIMAILMLVLLWAMQIIKQILGIKDDFEFEQIELWTSSDQLLFEAGEKSNLQQGQWPTPQHPLTLAGRGQLSQHHWRGS